MNEDNKDQQVDEELAKCINEQQIAQGPARFSKDQQRSTRSKAYQQGGRKWTGATDMNQTCQEIAKQIKT